jgi:hypothetical protein
MLLLIYILCSLAHSSSYGCTKEKGTYVINMMIHANNKAMYKIRDEVNRDQNKQIELKAAVKHYFNVILDRVNATLEGYKVQVLGDYREMFLDSMQVFVDPTVCSRPMIAESLAGSLKTQLAAGGDTGNRIVVYECSDAPGSEPRYYPVKGGACGHLLVMLSPDVVQMEDQLVEQIYKMVADSLMFKIPPISTLYRDNLCDYVMRCAVNNDPIGRFHRELKSVRHTAYIVKTRKLKFIGHLPTDDLGIISRKENKNIN